MQFTLKELLDKYKVVVPQIQRDYAQGRDSAIDLRKGFVSKIKQTLEASRENLNLDFVYGYTEKIRNEEQAFIPLDGQQRLTTLWLIHWHLAPRVNNLITPEVQKYLEAFTYETRLSSKRFCYSLISQPLERSESNLLSEQIKDAPWFMASWNNDPTVISMLNMLGTLQEEMPTDSESWNNLINNRKITFDYIDIKSDEFKLTDELYIKMNSRGKPLTPFENFKAQFSGLLSSKETDYANEKIKYKHTSVTYQQYFAFKIDSAWMDLFWKYRDKTDSEIDSSIYKFINYVAELLFFKNNPNATSIDVKQGFEFLNKIFAVKANIDFLFQSLDFLSSLNNVGSFFEVLFNDLSAFDDYSEDYFYRAITDTGFDVKDKTIFYAVLTYCINKPINIPDDEIKNFIRITRNLLLAVRQTNQSKRIEYKINLRLPNVSDYCKFIDGFISQIQINHKKSVYQVLAEKEFSGFTKENIAYEKSKAALIVANPKLIQSFHSLEEHPQVQGNTANFKLNSNDIANKIDAFLKIWSADVEDSLIIRAYLTIDDYSVMTHSYSSLDAIWYFGSQNNWNRILTATDKNERTKVSNSLDSFLAAFNSVKGGTAFEKLQSMIDNFKPDIKDWRYYFVKYEAIANNPFRNLNLYTWEDSNGFDINHLGNSGNQPLHSYHLNPYLIALKQQLKGIDKVKLFWGRFTDISFLRIDEKISIKCKSNGWEIKSIDTYALDKKLIKKYNLNQQGDSFMLSESETKDRIEIAVDFIKEFVK